MAKLLSSLVQILALEKRPPANLAKEVLGPKNEIYRIFYNLIFFLHIEQYIQNNKLIFTLPQPKKAADEISCIHL